MYKITKIVLVLVSCLSLSALPVSAKSDDAAGYVEDFENIVPGDVDFVGEELLSGVGVDRLFAELLSAFREGGGDAIAFFLLLLGLGLAGALADFSVTLGNKSLGSASCAGVSALSALLVFSRLEGLTVAVKESLDLISSFFASLIPIVSGLSLSGGAVNSASIQAVNMNITLAVIGKLSSAVLMPLVFVMFSLALVSSVGDGGATRLAKGARSVFMWALGILTTVLIAAISMQSFLASTKDGAALRAAKYALSGSIPIVGSTVSGALGTLTGALSEASALVGVGSVAVIFITAASPLILMLLYRLTLSVAIWLFEFVGSRVAENVFSAFRSALDALISVFAVSAIVYVLEIVIFIRGGVSVFV